MKNFWNCIGLPSAKDIRVLAQTCQEQQQQISSLEREVQELKTALSTHIDEIWKQATERQDNQTSALCRMIQTSLDAQGELLKQLAETVGQSAEKNHSALTASQKDILNRLSEQNEWLRMAVINSLRNEVDAVLTDTEKELAAAEKSKQKPADSDKPTKSSSKAPKPEFTPSFLKNFGALYRHMGEIQS